MNQKRWLVWPLLVLWVPVGVVYGILRVIVFLTAKGAWKVNKGLWWLHSWLGDFAEPVAVFFGDSIIFEKKRKATQEKLKKKLDGVSR